MCSYVDLIIRRGNTDLVIRENDISDKRIGTEYCVRKAKNKKIVHDLSNSILIDDMPHEEISKIFKKVEKFISYDEHTTYSYFAALCDCDSIVIPTEGVSEEEWLPNVEDRYGLSYGFENIDSARETRRLLPNFLQQLEERSSLSVIKFLEEIDIFFE